MRYTLKKLQKRAKERLSEAAMKGLNWEYFRKGKIAVRRKLVINQATAVSQGSVSGPVQ